MGELAQGMWESLADRHTPERMPGRRGGPAVPRFHQLPEGPA